MAHGDTRRTRAAEVLLPIGLALLFFLGCQPPATHTPPAPFPADYQLPTLPIEDSNE